MRLLRFLAGYVRPFWLHILLSFICLGAATVLALKVPDLFGELMDKVFINRSREMLWHVCLLVLIVFLLKGIFTWLQAYLMSFAGQKMIINLRNDVYSHLQELPLGFYEKRHSGEIVSTLTNDIGVIQASLSGGALNILAALAILAGALVKMLLMNWQLTLLTLVVMPAMALIVGIFSRRIHSITTSVQRKLSDITTIIQETISGIRVVKSFTMEKHEVGRFREENEKSFDFVMRGVRFSASLTPVMDLLFAAGAVVILWFGGLMVINRALTPGQFMAFIVLLGLASSPLSTMGVYVSILSQASAALSRLYAIMLEHPEVKDAPGAVEPPQIVGRVIFDDVSFAYEDGLPVLQNVSLSVEPGSMVALVGPSGSGKSTLANLIPRFYLPQSGSITIDGIPVEKLRLTSLRRAIGIVPQETVLFGGSIRENIRYGRPNADEAEVEEAARAANAAEFINALPEGYDTEIGERGLRLSGGQRQRIAVARAILRNPRILILDEATSSLDTHSETLVQEALERLMKSRTTFVIAHRLSTIRKADHIVVIDDGRIAEQGSHEELLSADGIYAELYRAQFTDHPTEITSPEADPLLSFGVESTS